MFEKPFTNVYAIMQIGDALMSEKVKETKEKILNWLKEEGLSPEEIADPNAYYNFGIKVAGGSPLNVIQHVHNIDSILIGTNLVLMPNQINLLKNNMDEKKRQEFFWNLRLTLLRNNELGDFQIKPNPPNDVREVFISSKRIFYDALSKDRLISSGYSVYRAVMEVVWMLELYAGAVTPKETKTSFSV